MTEKVFANGFVFKKREKAPDFVIGSLSVKVDEAILFLKEHASDTGWVNLNINMGKSGKPYIELDTWKPTKDSKPVSKKKAKSDDDDVLPF